MKQKFTFEMTQNFSNNKRWLRVTFCKKTFSFLSVYFSFLLVHISGKSFTQSVRITSSKSNDIVTSTILFHTIDYRNTPYGIRTRIGWTFSWWATSFWRIELDLNISTSTKYFIWSKEMEKIHLGLQRFKITVLIFLDH